MSVEIEFLSRICPKDGGRHQVGVVRVYTEEVRGTPRRERACYKCGLRDTFIQETPEPKMRKEFVNRHDGTGEHLEDVPR